MGSKSLVVASIDQRHFVKEVLRLGALGAQLDETKPVFKVGVVRATLTVDETVDVGDSPITTVVYKEPQKEQTKEQEKSKEDKETETKESPKAAKKAAKKSKK